jgi:hypothetical protein
MTSSTAHPAHLQAGAHTEARVDCHRPRVQGASRSSASRVFRHACCRAGLRPNAAPRATAADTRTSTSREIPAAAVSGAAAEYPPTASGTSAAPARHRCGRVLRLRFTLSSLSTSVPRLLRGPALSEPWSVEWDHRHFAGF